MEVIHQSSECLKYARVNKIVSIARWKVEHFFDYVICKESELESKRFELYGMDAKFFMNINLSYNDYVLCKRLNFLSYCLNICNMNYEKSIKVEHKFWLENSKGEKCAETPGKCYEIEIIS